MDFLKKFSNKRKMKYGAVLAGFLAILIVITIVFNALVTFLCERFNLFVDMTDEQFYSASDEFLSVMQEQVVDKEISLEIIFFQARDKIEADYSSVDGKVGLAYVNQTVTHLADELDNITVSYRSSDDHDFVNKFSLGIAEKEMIDQCVVVRRTDIPEPEGEKYTQFEIYQAGDFYVADSSSSLFAYNGEVVLIESVIRLTTNSVPTVYFVINHDEGSDFAYDENGTPVKIVTFSNLAKIFTNAGYVYRAIDLEEQIYTCDKCGKQYSPTWDWGIDIDDPKLPVINVGGEEKTLVASSFECDGTINGVACKSEKASIYREDLAKRASIPDDADAVVIYEPQGDYYDDEIELLESYLYNNKTIMCFLDPEVPSSDMTNLYGFFKSVGGINVHTSKVEDPLNKTPDGFKATIPSNEATNTYFNELSISERQPIVNDTVYLTIDEKYLPGNAGTGDNVFTQSEILMQFPPRVLPGNESPVALMTITNMVSTLTNPGGGHQGNADFDSYLMVCAGGDFADDYHIISSSVNTEMLRRLVYATLGEQAFPTDVEFKVFNNYTLAITQTQAIAIFVASLTILPALTLIVGFVVIFRRKRK